MILEIDSSDIDNGFNLIAFVADQLTPNQGWPAITGVVTNDKDAIIWADRMEIPVLNRPSHVIESGLLAIHGRPTPPALQSKIDAYRSLNRLVADYTAEEIL